MTSSLLLGLIGDGISASRTPRMHENEGAAHSIPTIYRTIDIGTPRLAEVGLEELLTGAVRLGFDGLVVTDDIGAAEAVADVPVPERATRLLEAGGDAVLTADPSLTGRLVDAIEEWAGLGEEQERRVRESAGRMLALKESLGLL